jgi:hypothetical protein
MLISAPFSGRSEVRRLVRFLLPAVFVATFSPVVVALVWYPLYPSANPTPGEFGSVRYATDRETVVVEYTDTPLVRVRRYFRAEEGELDPMRIPVGEVGRQIGALTEFATYCAPVKETVRCTVSPAPNRIGLSKATPYGLVASYGWPFSSVSCYVTGTLADAGVYQGTLHDAVLIRRGRKYLQWGSTLYLADVPYGNIPTRVNVVGLSANILAGTLGLYGAGVGLRWQRSFRRYLAGRCCRCGYELHGIVGGRCPECGWMLRWSRGTHASSHPVANIDTAPFRAQNVPCPTAKP